MRLAWRSGLWLGFVLGGCTGKEPEGPAPEPNEPTVPEPEPNTPTNPSTDDEDGDGFDADADCDDTDAEVFPGAPDLCDGRVTDCDRTSDDGLVTLDGAVGFDDLQAALDAASDGSELLLCPGTYTGAFTASVPVRMSAWEDAMTTVLQGSGGSVLQLPGGSEVIGLTLQGGQAEQGGGLYMTSAGTLLLERSLVSDNQAEFGGGLYIAPDSEVTLVDTRIDGNRATGGGGVHVSAGATLDMSGGGWVANNEAQAYGAGIWVDGGTVIGGLVSLNTIDEYAYPYYYYGLPDLTGLAYGGAGVASTGESTLTDVQIGENQAIYGAGLSVTGGTTLFSGEIYLNEAVQLGGGVVVWGGHLQLDPQTEIHDNMGGEAAGGALVVFGSMSGGMVRNNYGDEHAGGVWIYQGTLSDMDIAGNSSYYRGGGVFAIGVVQLDRVEITENESEMGGGICTDAEYGDFFYGYTPTIVTITDSSITQNQAARGGGIFAGWDFVVSDTDITDNLAQRGAGVHVGEGDVSLFGGRVVDNEALQSGGGVEVTLGTLTVEEVDFGEDGDDNYPSDVQAVTPYAEFGVGSTFVCDSEGCT